MVGLPSTSMLVKLGSVDGVWMSDETQKLVGSHSTLEHSTHGLLHVAES